MKSSIAVTSTGSALWLAALLFAQGPVCSQAAGFALASFGPEAEVLVQGGATLTDGRARLTPASPLQRGAVWQACRRSVSAGFDTVFQFQITRPAGQGEPGGEGFAFVIQNNAVPALGIGADGLGYTGVRNCLAVEFDTRQSEPRHDPNANHISIHLLRTQTNSADHTHSLGAVSDGLPNLADGAPHTARITCLGTTLAVYLDDLDHPVLTVALPPPEGMAGSLDEALGLADGQAWIGFTATTGDAGESHDLLSWSFLPAPSPLTVSLTTPLDGASFVVGTRITLGAAASSTGLVTRLEFYQGTTRLGQTETSPFQFAWKDATPGSFWLTAVATDDTGRRAVSEPVRIVVYPTAPPIGLQFATGQNGAAYPLDLVDQAGQIAQRAWNSLTVPPEGSGMTFGLRNGAGTMTAARVGWDFASTAEEPSLNPALSGDHKLMKAYVADDAGGSGGQTNSTITVSQIPFAVYDVLVYSDGANGGADSVTEFRLRGQSLFLRDGAWASFSGAFVEGTGTADQGPITPAGNYVCFRGQTNSSFTLTVTARSSSDGLPRAAVNGLQIVPSLSSGPPQVTRGPYLQLATPASIVVRWRTSRPTDTRLRYGSAAASLTVTNDDLTISTEHLVTLTNLSPATRYFYAVGTTETNLLAGAEYHFNTFPDASVPTRVWFISDYGFRNSGEQAVRNSYFNFVAPVKPADVWITGGDNDQTDGTDAHDQDAIFGTNYAYGALLRNLPVWPTPGNHDYQTAQAQAFYANFTLPAHGEAGGVPSGTEHYYSFNHGDVHLISLDSIDGTLSVSPDAPMIQWLRDDLAHATQRWIIAYWHGPPYTKGTHDSDSTTDTLSWMTQMRQNVLPVLEAHGVDLVLCGHSHVYERSWMLNGHYDYSWTFSETNKIDGGDGKPDGLGAYLKSDRAPGTVYVTAAVGGNPQSDPFAGSGHPAHILKITNTLGSLVIDIAGDRLDYKYIGTNGGTLDNFSISKAPVTIPPAAPASLVISNLAGGRYQLHWENTPTNEMRWFLERSTDGLTFLPLATLGANFTNYTDPTLFAGRPALYRLRAWNTAGDSEYSPVALAGISGRPYVTGLSRSNDQVTVRWLSLPDQVYEVLRTYRLDRPFEEVRNGEVQATGFATSLTLPADPAQPTAFFRVRLVQ